MCTHPLRGWPLRSGMQLRPHWRSIYLQSQYLHSHISYVHSTCKCTITFGNRQDSDPCKFHITSSRGIGPWASLVLHQTPEGSEPLLHAPDPKQHSAECRYHCFSGFCLHPPHKGNEPRLENVLSFPRVTCVTWWAPQPLLENENRSNLLFNYHGVHLFLLCFLDSGIVPKWGCNARGIWLWMAGGARDRERRGTRARRNMIPKGHARSPAPRSKTVASAKSMKIVLHSD